MRRRKLLVAHPSRIRGGCEEYAMTMAKAAARAGWSVVGAFPCTEANQSMIEDIRALPHSVGYYSLPVSEIRGVQGQNRWNVFKHFLASLWVMLRGRPEACLLALPTIQYMAGTIYASALLRIPTVVCFQYVHVFPYPDGCYPFPNWMLRLHRWARERGQQYVAISKNNRALVARNFRMPEEAIAVIYNGASERFAQITAEERAEKRAAIRGELGIARDTTLMLTIAALRRQKGHDLLIAALPELCRKHPDTYWVWAGGGPEQETIEKQLRESGHGDRVTLLGHRTDVDALLCAADYFVFPTRFEGGQSFALGEAMMAGVPVITTNASGIPEVVVDKEHAVVVEKENADALRHGIDWALEHPEAMHAMAQRAQERVKAFSETVMITQMLEALETLTEGASKEATQ
ncbi:MAG: glycosyltransferase family 4 protein [Candidatus Hydrogenedentota bacterium]